MGTPETIKWRLGFSNQHAALNRSLELRSSERNSAATVNARSRLGSTKAPCLVFLSPDTDEEA